PETTAVLAAHALIQLADIAVRAGDLEAARGFLFRARTLPAGDDAARLAIAENLAVTLDGDGGRALRAYFWGGSPRFPPPPAIRVAHAMDVIEAMPASPLGYYLLGRNLVGLGAPEEVVAALARALDIGFDGPLFTRECARLLAAQAFMAQNYQEVERAAEILADPAQPTVTRLLGRDWIERIYFARHGKLPP
ncbi:MAG TPA: hypothetical protein VFG83_19580, partial [Kofleriaceae bacterium]|nr:hypothetical protein [Kofleriaceae bacterium]